MNFLPASAAATASTETAASAVPSHRPVRTLLIWLVLFCLLPGVIGAVGLFAYEYREARAQRDRDTVQTARALVQAVDNYLLKAQAVAQVLSTSDALLQNDLAHFHRQARAVVSLAGLGTNVILRDEAGHQVLNTVVDYGKPLSSTPAPEQVRSIFQAAKPSVSDVFVGPVLKRPLVTVDVPVIVGGKVVYALGVGILPEHFNKLLQTQDLPHAWVVAILDSKGTIVARTHSFAQYVGHQTSPSVREAMAKVREGSAETKTVEGIPVRSSFSRSPTTDWGVIIGIPLETRLELARTLTLLAFGVAVLLAISLIVARFMGARIARSVQVLIGPAAALGRGEWTPVPRVHIKEASEVAAAIERAAVLHQVRAAALHVKEVELAEAHRLAKFGTWRWNLATGDVIASDSIREIYGRELPPFHEQRGTVLTVESWERANAAQQEAMRTGAGYDLELQAIHGSGAAIWINSKGEAIHDESGQVVALRGTVLDITARREVEEELRKFKSFSDYANDVHFLLDASGRILYANKLASMRLGYSEAELLGMRIADIDPNYSHERFQAVFANSKQVRPAPFEVVHRRKDGTTLPVEVTSTVLKLGGEWLMFATSRDITERKIAEQRVLEAAMHDRLTGLPNRALVFEYGGHLFAGAKRNHTRGALLFIDLDRFKPINDLYGHKIGDRVLQEVAKRLVDCTRHEDLVGRLGGDEFVIILPHLDPGQHRAAVVAQHVIDSITRPFRVEDLELSLSPSIGISYFPQHAMDVGVLIHTADMAMYQAKQAGRANYQFYTPELERIADEMLMLETQLKNALRHGGLELHYQPVVDLRSGRMIGAEALARLSSNDGRTIGPSKFIPVAESAGLIGELGEWVAAEACRQHDVWLSEGLRITIAINVSPLQFRQRAFAQRLGRIVAENNIDPQCLQIEVTESAVMDSVDEAIVILNQLKSLGMKVALDDFGTGYSSLSSLSSLPLDKLKVDQSFVRRIVRDPRSQAITKAVIALGRALHLEIVGEGIESEETWRYLHGEGCDQAQGFWFSEPLPAPEFASWCRRQHVFADRTA